MSFSHWVERAENDKKLRSFLSIATSKEMDTGWAAIPPGTPLEDCVSAFEAETDIPSVLTVMSYFSLLSHYLVKRRVTLEVEGAKLNPDLWTIVLADSGSGKTYCFEKLQKSALEVLGISANFASTAGAAAFIAEFSEHNRALWFADEFAQFMSQVETPNSPLAPVKEYLLKAYSGSKIERKTKLETVTVFDPLLTIYAVNTPASFVKKISAESLTDGFAQRFAFLFAKSDEARNFVDYPWYSEKRIQPRLTAAFQRIATLEIAPAYVVGAEAFRTFKLGFSELFKASIDKSFYRRIMFRAFKLALLYHINSSKAAAEIDADDMKWALRLTRLHIESLKQLLNMHRGFADFAHTMSKAQAMHDRDPDSFTPRKLQQSVREIKTNANAGALAKRVHKLITEEAEAEPA